MQELIQSGGKAPEADWDGKAEEEDEEPATKRAPTLKRDREEEEERKCAGHHTKKWGKSNGLSPKPNESGDQSDDETCAWDGAQEDRTK